MANGGQIRYSVGFDVDKTGLNQIRSSLQEIKNLTAQDLMRIGGHNDLQRAKTELDSLKASVATIDDAFKKAFNTDLGTLNVAKFNQSLKNLNLNKIYQDFSKAGAAGQTAFRNMTSQILTTNMQLKQTNNFINNMATTMANTIKWGVASSVMNSFTGSVRKAYGYVKNLDTSLNDIRIVTGASADEMERFATKANNAAKELGKSTTDYTEAALIYYQQGLGDEEVEARTETTLKAANVTGQSGQEVSEQLTAVWNGYKVSAEEAELYVDKLAAVAATTASNLEELSTGMSKVASAANLMGVDVDSLNAQISTIIAVTRQAPESVGTALKTIYARMGDIEAGLDGEVSLDMYTSKMAEMGINVLDTNGKLRDMGDVIEEIGGKWQSMSREQQLALSQTMAGTRQYNNLLALFDNWGNYTKALETSRNAAGTLQEQQDTYMESTRAHLNQLRAASEDLYDSLLDPKGLNPLIDGLTSITNLFANFIDVIGGGSGALLGLGIIGAKVFGNQIARGLTTTVKNLLNVRYNAEQVSAQFQVLSQFKGLDIKDTMTQRIIDWKQGIINLGSVVTEEQHNEANALIKTRVELENQYEAWNQNKQAVEDYLKSTNVYQGSLNSVVGKENSNAKNIDTKLTNRINDYKQAQQSAANYQATIHELNNALIRKAQAYKETGDASSQSRAKELELVEASKKVQEATGEIIALAQLRLNRLSVLDQESQEYKELTAAVQEYYKAVASGDENKIADASQRLVDAFSNANNKLMDMATNAKNVVSQQAHGMSQEFTEAINKADAAMNAFGSSLAITGQIKSITNAFSAMGSMAMSLNSLLRIDQIVKDETIDNSQKLLQIMMALSMAAPGLSKVVTGVATSYARATQIIDAKRAVMEAEQAASVISTQLAQKEAQAEILEFQATRMANTSEEQSALLKQASNVQKEISALLSEKEAAAEALETTQQKLANAEEKKSIAIKMALWAIQNPLIALMGGATVLALGGAALAWSRYNKKVEETLTNSIENLNESTSALDNFKSKLQEIQDQLDELYSKEHLTLTDKEDIANLEKERIELETQYELEKKINEERQKQVALAGQRAIDNGNFDYSGEKSVSDVKGNASTIDVSTEETKNAWIEGQVSKYGERFRSQIEDLANSYYDEYHGELVNNMSEDLSTLQETVKAAQESGETEIAKNAQEKVAELYEATGVLNDTLFASMNAAFEGDIDEQEQVHAALQSGEATGENGQWTDDDLRAAGLAEEQINNLKFAADAAYMSLDTYIKKYRELGSTELEGTFENSLTKMTGMVEDSKNNTGYDSNYAGAVMADLRNKYGVDDSFMNQALEQLDFSKIDFSDLKEGSESAFAAALEDAMLAAGDQEVLNQRDAFNQDVEAKGEDYSEKYGIDAEQYSNLSKILADTSDEIEGVSDELSEMGEEGAEAAKELAKEFLRYDKAVESVKENSKEWMKILKSDNLQDKADIVDDLADAYGNMFDVDGSHLSADFLQNTENLELMQEAAKGSEESYDKLRAKMGENIIAQVGLDPSMYYTHLAQVEAAALEAEGMGLADIQAGASLDNTAFLNSLSEIVTNAGLTAEAAEDYLSDMGIDAEVVNDTQTVEEVVGFHSNPIVSYKEASYKPAVEGEDQPGDATATYPRVTYLSTPVKRTKTIAGTGLKVTSARKSSGGAVKFKNSSHGSGANKGGSSGGGGGGGGGGSTKKATKSKLDKNKKTIDRYHDVNNELSKLGTTMDRLADAQEHLFGRELYDNLNKQLKVLNKQIAASKEKLKIAKEEREELQQKLEDKGFTFDIDGDISNYAAKLEEYQKEINAKITKYNNLSAKKQNRKAGKKLKEEIEKLQEEYDEIEELIGDYDDLLINTIPELEDEITQLARQKVEIEVEKFKIEAELRLEISEAVRDWNDFKKEIFKDSKNVADAILDTVQNGLINSGSLAKSTQDLNTTNKAIADIKAGKRTAESEQYLLRDDEGNILYDKNGNYQFDMAKALETQEGYMDNVKDAISSFYDDMDEMYDNYLESVETAIESTEKYQDALETVSDVLEHTMNMITAINGEDAFDEIGKVIEKQLDATTNMIKSAQDEIARISGPQFDKDGNELPSRLNQAQAELDGLTQEIATKEAQIANMEDGAEKTQALIELETMKRMADAKKSEIEAYQEALNSNQEILRESLEEYVDLLTQQYENMIAQANKSFENFMSGGLGREGMDREWQNAIAEEDKYLDAVNAAYELRSLESKINDSISATDSLAAQRKLNQFKEEELKKLREKDKLTKYDVERANKLYEIELKKIALEEAQNNKAQMRLRRDSSGNYSYQFVADQESVNKAQQELDTAMNDLYNMDKEEYRSRLEEVSQVEQDFEDFRMWYSEQSAEYRAEHEEWYLEQCKSYQKQLTDSSSIAAEARNNTIDSANKAMGESFNQVVMESMLPTWDTAMADMVDRVNNPESGFKAAATSAMNSVVDASKALAEALKELNSLLGLSDGGLTDITSSYYTAAEQGAKDYATAQQANIDNTWKEVDAVKALVDEFEKLAKAKETAGLLAGGVSAVEQGTNTGNSIRDKDADSIATNPETPDDPAPATTMVATLKTERKKKIAANILYGKSRNDWGPEGSVQQKDLLEEVFGPEQAKKVLDFVAEHKNEDTSKSGSLYKYYTNKTKKKKDDKYLTYATAKGFKKDKEVPAFDTGGYTGDWDDNSGRVAVLHKKELVLNAKDTENLLKTVNIVRKITEDAISGKANKDKKDLDYKISTLLQSVVDISNSLAPMLQTDKWNVLQDEVKQESLNALTEQLTNLGVNLQEFQGADFLIALDHLNNTKDNLQSLVQTNQSQLLLNSDNAEQELALLEKLNQAMINDVASVIQTQTEKISNNEANQEQILMRMLEETMKSAERDNDIQQTVEIHADFPNATNTDEIQKAFENLVNAASQHAFINKR